MVLPMLAIAAAGYVLYARSSEPVKNSGTLADAQPNLTQPPAPTCGQLPVSAGLSASLLPKDHGPQNGSFAPEASKLLAGQTFLSGGAEQIGIISGLNKNAWTGLRPAVPVPVVSTGPWNMSAYMEPADFHVASTCGYKAQAAGTNDAMRNDLSSF
jgi:hypothetical protein